MSAGRRAHTTAALIAAILLSAIPARATIVTVAFKGVVDLVDDSSGLLGGDIRVGDVMQGTYTYDTAAEDLNPRPHYLGTFYFYQPPSGMSMTIRGHTFEADFEGEPFSINVVDNFPAIASVYDEITMLATSGIVLPEDVPILQMALRLTSDHIYGDPLSSDALPLTAPVVNDWDESNLHILCDTNEGFFTVDGHLTDAVLIPEPSTILLLAAAAIALPRKPRTPTT